MGITLDISRVAYESKPDIVVLVSGDQDFIPIVLELRGKGIRVETAAFSVAMSRELARKSSGYINLDLLIHDESDQVEFDQVEPDQVEFELNESTCLTRNVEGRVPDAEG